MDGEIVQKHKGKTFQHYLLLPFLLVLVEFSVNSPEAHIEHIQYSRHYYGYKDILETIFVSYKGFWSQKPQVQVFSTPFTGYVTLGNLLILCVPYSSCPTMDRPIIHPSLSTASRRRWNKGCKVLSRVRGKEPAVNISRVIAVVMLKNIHHWICFC